jgi:IS30 family transposase
MKIQRYKQLTDEDREKLFELLEKGQTLRRVAAFMGRHVSTISRELKRNSHQRFGFYLPDTASRKNAKRKLNGRKRQYLEKSPHLRAYILERLILGWTPQLISGRMRLELGVSVNHETIYQFIYSKEGRRENWRQYLPRAHRIRRKKKGRKPQRGKIPNRIDIGKRPRRVEKRRDFGHWEGDSVLYRGHHQTLATQVERKSRYLLLGKPKDRTARERNRIFRNLFQNLPTQARQTMTVDNGLEFAGHERIGRKIGLRIYFAKPYSSWQRGTNEWMNGLLRRYLPREMEVRRLQFRTILRVQEAINNRPMKCLDYQTPKEVYRRELNRLSLCKENGRKSPSVALTN